jgi:geranylgeranyl pyrophosphate synthase
MQLISLATLPRAVPIQRERVPQANIPQTPSERERARRRVTEYAALKRLVPPLSARELRHHAEIVTADNGFDPAHADYIGVLLNNETWRDALASVPYDRRLLLLPKCLRVEDRCPAPFDEIGLLCKRCGLCSIQDLQEEAEQLGYAVLVAEGSALVMALIQAGRIDAIVGVSCLNVLERAFPYMEAAAIPGVAIPLLQDDCKDTTVDVDWIWDVIHLTSDDKTYRLDLDALRRVVDDWFSEPALSETLGPTEGEADRIAREWLTRAGKRWRPFLTACAFKSLQSDPDEPLPADLRKIAVAVECFHKASLIHDDIEDGDSHRYGERALHEEYGIPVALNVGDLLLGEGYRLLAECDAPARVRSEMLRIASRGHRTLCLGQGAELSWAREPRPLVSGEVLEIFRRKTAPAFEVALHLGVAFAQADPALAEVVRTYSEALGIAYQIRDDIQDLEGSDPGDVAALRPTLPLALALENAKSESQRRLLRAAWQRSENVSTDEIRAALDELSVEDRCRHMLESYKEAAIRSLTEVENPSFKGLLRRVIGKIFSVEVKGWCSEFETRNAPGSEVGAALTR